MVWRERVRFAGAFFADDFLTDDAFEDGFRAVGFRADEFRADDFFNGSRGTTDDGATDDGATGGGSFGGGLEGTAVDVGNRRAERVIHPATQSHTPGAGESREHLYMARYATLSRDSRGRLHAEPPHPYRGPFVRDRDRILHSSAFRRLSGKMQVFTGEFGVYHRTRLTHTLEVSTVARTIARTLGLNEDLVEALSLMHDIGHPPFGHCGEDALDECLSDVGGFSHNQFALTIVTELERRYERFDGLNLSVEVLAGQDTRAHKAEAAVGRAPILEVQVVDLADSIAYDAHDVDDAIQMGLLSIEQLRDLSLVRHAMDRLRDRHGVLPVGGLRPLLVKELVEMQVSDLLNHSAEMLHPLAGYRASEICDAGIRIGHDPEFDAERRELESFLFDSVYRHPRLIPIRRDAADRVVALFDGLTKHRERLPLRFRGRMSEISPARVVGEYIAGMTDAFCNAQYERMRGSATGPLSDW